MPSGGLTPTRRDGPSRRRGGFLQRIANEYTGVVREIRWTEKAEDHVAGHDVTPDEVEQVVHTRPRLVLAGREQTEYVWRLTGATTWSPPGT